MKKASPSSAAALQSPPSSLHSNGDAKDKKSGFLSYLVNFWIFIPAVIYFSLVNKYAVNIPYQDDYAAVLEFLNKFKAATGIDKIILLFSQHADHRIFHSRVIYVLYYYIFGKINFVHLIFLGNLELVGIFLLLVHFIRKAVPRYWNVVSVVVGLCLFDISSFENADFAMCGIQNYGIILLFMLSFYFFDKNGRANLILGGLFEAICIFSSGNGLIGAVCLIIFSIVKMDKTKIILSSLVFMACTSLYYIHYSKVNATGEISDLFKSMRDVRFFFLMMGSHFSYEYGIPAGVLVLALLVVLSPVSIKLKIKENTLPFICLLGFVLGTVVTISIFRSGWGEVAAYWSRYMIYSHLIVAMLFVFLWIKFDGKRLVWYLSGISLVLLLVNYKSNFEYGEGCLGMFNRRLVNYPYCYGRMTQEDLKKAKALEEDACREGIYCIKDER